MRVEGFKLRVWGVGPRYTVLGFGLGRSEVCRVVPLNGIQIRGFRATGLGFSMHLRIFEFVHGGFAPDLRGARPSLVEVATS